MKIYGENYEYTRLIDLLKNDETIKNRIKEEFGNSLKEGVTDVESIIDGMSCDVREQYIKTLQSLRNTANEIKEEFKDDDFNIANWLDCETLREYKYTIDQDGEYKGVQVTYSLGGPSIWIDTNEKALIANWGTMDFNVSLDKSVCEQIDEQCEIDMTKAIEKNLNYSRK